MTDQTSLLTESLYDRMKRLKVNMSWYDKVKAKKGKL